MSGRAAARRAPPAVSWGSVSFAVEDTGEGRLGGSPPGAGKRRARRPDETPETDASR